MDDVVWIGGSDFEISREEFLKLADCPYDAGYGAPEVATDLVLVGNDFWLERQEYDGSEFVSLNKRTESLCYSEWDHSGYNSAAY